MEGTEESREEGNLVFAVNGERFEVSAIDPSTTVLEFLRSQTPFKSVKLGCGEGGCGACAVLVSKYDPVSDQVEDHTLNSCLTLLCSINGCSITTTEGIGNSKKGFHAIHQRIAGFHASQCGFCTPGMCVSLFSALLNAEKKKNNLPNPSLGFSKISVSEAEKSIAGNLCRCTGYRPIVDACKSFASEVDIEDLGFNSFWQNGDTKEIKLSKFPSYEPSCQIQTFPEFLKKESNSNIVLDSKRYAWYSPVSITELQRLLGPSNGANDTTRVKLVVSNTGTGYYKELDTYDIYIDLSKIPELSIVKKDSTCIQIGAALTITKAIAELKDSAKNTPHNDSEMIVLTKISDHLEKIASGSVRNAASVGGNLAMAQRSGFPSDIATVLLAIDAVVEITSGFKSEIITLEEFLESPPLDSRSIIVSVKIPIWKQESGRKLLFETYRAAPRPLGNALPYLNAAFLAEICQFDGSNDFKVNTIRLAFGAYGTKHAIRARKVEEFLVGKTLDYEVLQETMNLMQETVVPEDGVSHSSYRKSLAKGFLFKFLEMFSENSVDSEFSSEYRVKEYESICSPTQLLPSKQIIVPSTEHRPVGDPITKTGAALQASGEAVYVDDIPSPTDCLYGAFIYSTKPMARIKRVHFKLESLPNGVSAILSYKDIPHGGENVGAKTMFGGERLFADDLTRYAGERIALVVADTQKRADMAAALAIVDYDTDNLDAPILTVEDAVEKSSFFVIPSFISPKQVGDFKEGMAVADHKIHSAEIRLPSQYYFYMETQTALAVPDEDNCMVVYSSVQAPEYTHSVVAKCLGVPANNIRVITRRVGGGFGGKAVRAMPVAAASALAAHKLNRPVRIYLNRKTDMITTGGRHPMKVTYTVGFKSDGKITALHFDILIDAGISEDISPIMPSNIYGAIKKYNWGSLSCDIKVCKTNHTSKSAMRGPGEVQGTFIAEAVIEHVAASLCIDVDIVRNANLHTFESLSLFYENGAGEKIEYTLPSIWDKVATSSSYNQRSESVKKFNESRKWKKRGISKVPIVYEVTLRATPGKVSILSDGSVVVEVGGIELGQGLWTKVKQMTAYALSLVNCSGTEEILDKVRVIQADTLSMIQGGFTAGSTTSESSCEAVRICCDVLVERLMSVKEKLERQTGFVTWGALVLQAYAGAVNMSASSYYVPEYSSMKYLNYGAAVSEVEIDLLTGETTILRSDIIYDCGQSLNPAVDLGQIEGAFVQGIGFFMTEEYLCNSDGLVTSDSTWSYKIPTIDTIPKQFNVEIVNSGHHEKRVLSSKASGEPPLLLASSVHCATRAAVKAARKQLASWGGLEATEAENPTQLIVPATMPVVKELCGLDIVESYLKANYSHHLNI